MNYDYDLAIIGAGPAGYSAALEAVSLGMRTALIEARDAGGTCLNRGCVPTKTLLHAALLREQALAEPALEGELRVNAEKLAARRDEVVLGLRGGLEKLLASKKVELLSGKARITAAHELALENRSVTANNILVATGSEPALPPIEGAELPSVMTSDGALRLECVPDPVVIIGGGVIGMEFASLYLSLGTRVTVIEALPRILANLDREISQNLSMIMKKRGAQLHCGARVTSITRDGVFYEENGAGAFAQAEKVLVAAGRRPALDGIFADGLEIAREKGGLTAPGYKTSVEGIYAAGDVRDGSVKLAHAAAAEGINAVRAMAGLKAAKDMTAVPSCVYTEPEIASVGVTADEAKAAGTDTVAGKAIFSANAKSVIAGAERSFAKLVFRRDDGKLVGAQLMCGRATDIISGLGAAVDAGLTCVQLAAAVYPHPTFGEVVGEAANAALEKLQNG